MVIAISAPDFRAGGSSLGAPDRSGRSLSSLSLHGDQTFENYSLRRNESIEPERKANLERAVKEAGTAFAQRPSGWFVLSGTYGCGKTHLAAAIANYQITTGQPAPLFIVVPDLLDHLRATFSPASMTTLDHVFEQVRTTPLLILDDLGTESATPWAHRRSCSGLLNHRYATRLPTVITTSARVNEISKRLQSRMLDTSRCTFFTITAPGYRGSESQQTAYNGERPSDPSPRIMHAARSPRPEQPASRNAVPLGIEWPTLSIVVCTLAQCGASRP